MRLGRTALIAAIETTVRRCAPYARSALSKSLAQLHPHRRMIARALPCPRFAIDIRGDGLLAQRVGDQRQIDAQAEIAAEVD